MKLHGSVLQPLSKEEFSGSQPDGASVEPTAGEA